MANPDAAFGLRPVRYRSGAPYNGATNRYCIPASDTDGAYYIGGLVKLAVGSDANGVPNVTGNVATSHGVIGVITSVEPVTRESTTYRENSTLRYVYVADDPDLIFECQDDGAGGGIEAAEAGMVADLASMTSGSAATGRSIMEISSGTATASYTAGTSDHDVEIIRLSKRAGNEIGANAVWEVRLLNHAYGPTLHRYVAASA